MRRFLMGLVLAGSLLAVAAPAVLGHECYIANRSEQGNAGALHSSRWVRLSLGEIFGFINQFVGGPALTDSQISWAVDTAIAQGVPANGWVVRSDIVIGEKSKNPNLANGKGLDHLVDAYGFQLASIYTEALNH